MQDTDGLHILLANVHGLIDDIQIESSIKKALASQEAVAPQIKVQHVDSIPQTIAGKAPLVKSNLSR